MITATPERIRRVIRESQFARVTNPAVLIQRGDAQDGYSRERESFFDSVDDAQQLLDEASVLLMATRSREAVEAAEPLQIGTTLPLSPTLPSVRLVNREVGFDRIMVIKGVSVDLSLDRNAIEAVG
jgi:hypothetical protein